MQLLAGTSGYSYKEWLGHFYPEKLPGSEMLHYYAEHFTTVEINNTFYRMPPESMLAQWNEQVPDQFTFTLAPPIQEPPPFSSFCCAHESHLGRQRFRSTPGTSPSTKSKYARQ